MPLARKWAALRVPGGAPCCTAGGTATGKDVPTVVPTFSGPLRSLTPMGAATSHAASNSLTLKTDLAGSGGVCGDGAQSAALAPTTN